MAIEKKDRPKTSPKDFFLHLLNMVTLYITAFGFGRLLFIMINYYYPDPLNPTYSDFFDQMRWSISSMIVAYPVYILSSRYLFKEYKVEPEKKNLRVKNWLEYFTLFGTAVIILVALMTVVYKFLGGEITIRFILKTLTVVYIAGLIFSYYMVMAREKFQEHKDVIIKTVLILSIISIIASIVGGFLSIGSPAKARARQFDQTRIDNLSYIQSEMINYWDRTRTLPDSLEQFSTALQVILPTNPETGTPYEFHVKSDLEFELCAVFNEDKPGLSPKGSPVPAVPYYNSGPYGQYQSLYNQNYTKGRNCFTYTINPVLFPVNPNLKPLQ